MWLEVAEAIGKDRVDNPAGEDRVHKTVAEAIDKVNNPHITSNASATLSHIYL